MHPARYFLIFAAFSLSSAGLAQAEVERRVVGNLVIEDIPEIPDRIAAKLRQYQNTRTAVFQGWDPVLDGMLLLTRFGETSQVHYVNRAGSARQQLTFFQEPVGAVAVSPNESNHGFIFSKDVGGGENYQLFYFDLDSGDYQLVTDGKSRNGAALWSNAGDVFAYYSTRRNQRDWDLYVADPANPDQAQMVLSEGGTWFPIDWSPDDRRLLIGRYVSINESYFYVLDLDSGELEQINPSDEKVAYGTAVFAKDGRGIYFTGDEGSEFLRLHYYDLEAKTSRSLTEAIPWDVGELDIAGDGSRLAFTVNDDGIARLYLMDTRSERYRAVSDLPIGQIDTIEFHPDNRRIAMVINTPQSPGDVYVLDARSRDAQRWTYSEVGGLNHDQFVIPELIRYPGFDEVDGGRRMIPAFFYLPRGEGPHPVLIRIHGGPESQYQPYFSSTIQFYVNEMGFAVLAPNVRGSAGYGKSYLQLDNGFKREDSVRDIGALLEWIAEQPQLDSSRIAVLGGSYGGYMVLSSLTHFNDRLACGVDVVGISNFVTFLENTREYRRDLRRAEYGDERDQEMRAFLHRISPTTNAHKITKPLLVVQGRNDPRVPVTESEQMVAEIRSNGGQVWYLMAEDEGHGFRKKTNRDYYTNAVALFLEECLRE